MNNNWKAVVGGALGLALSLRAASLESPHEHLADFARELIETTAHLHPMLATEMGMAGMDGELETPSEAARTAEIEQLRAWQRKLEAIASGFGASTSLTDRDDAKLLAAQLTRQLNELRVYQFDRKSYAAPANDIVGAIFTQFLHLPVSGKEGASTQDVAGAWRDIISRLEKAPNYIVAGERLVKTPGHLLGVVGSKELAGAPEFLKGALTDAAKDQLGAESQEFARFVRARDATLSAIDAAKTYIDTHTSHLGLRILRWADRCTIECCAMSSCCPSTPTMLCEWARTNWRMGGLKRRGSHHSQSGIRFHLGSRVAAAWLRAGQR